MLQLRRKPFRSTNSLRGPFFPRHSSSTYTNIHLAIIDTTRNIRIYRKKKVDFSLVAL